MLAFLSVIIALVTLAVFIAGLLAFLRDSKKLQNIWFFVFSCFLALWIPANYIDSNFPKFHLVNFFLKADFILAMYLFWALVGFVSILGSQISERAKARNRTIIYGMLVVNFVLTFLIGDNQIITSHTKANTLYINYSVLFNPYLVVISFYLLYVLIGLFLKRRNSSMKDRPALSLVLLGFYIAIAANVLTNLVFPFVVSSNSSVKELNVVGYLGLMALAVSVYVAITSQKLFDIRPIIARSLGYVFSIAAIAVIYVTPVVIITTKLLHIRLSTYTILLLVAVTCFVSIIFQPLKSRFDKITSRLFYRDYYDIQDVLDELGNLLVGSVNTNVIEKQSVLIMSGSVKPLFMEYLLAANSLDAKDRETLKHLKVSKSNMIITDEINNVAKPTLYQALTDRNIAIAVRLRTKDEDLGFILLGYKRSGQTYSDTDKRLLTIAADEIAISLQNALHFEEIQKFNITLQDKVDEATIKLRRANDKLRALDETKDDFISMASHQLRTPLTSVKGYLSMVLEGDVGNISKAQKDMLNQAFFSSQRMVYIIADLLNVSRLKTGKFIIERNAINLSHVIQQELAQVEEIASAKDIKIVYEKPSDFPVLMLDETKTRQAIMNFVDNAIYYTPASGEIKIRLIDNPNTIELRVEDDGIGVPKSEQHHLFTKFYRAGNARKARPDGTGLGLFMAKKVILAEGGSVIFESQEGKGSTFGFIFSKAKIKPSGNEPVKETSETKELAKA